VNRHRDEVAFEDGEVREDASASVCVCVCV
jgi:hypothetical protein